VAAETSIGHPACRRLDPPQHILAAVRATEINLSREEWYHLLNAARGEPLP